jgi:hypothetical protein
VVLQILRLLMLLLGIQLAEGVSHGKQQTLPLAPGALQFFIGQAYPSGNVYLKSFSPPGESFEWPAAISIVAVADVHPGLVRTQRLNLAEALTDLERDGQTRSLYIPGAEGMDALHRSCGVGKVVPEIGSHAEVSEDFFKTISDHCEPNQGIARYRGVPSGYSFMVLGFTEPLTVAAQIFLEGNALRPLAPGEEEKIRIERAGQASRTQCTTEPVSLDSARQLFEGVFDGGVKFRLSTYSNPGCYGHLMQTYILDLQTNSSTARTMHLVQYRGVL